MPIFIGFICFSYSAQTFAACNVPILEKHPDGSGLGCQSGQGNPACGHSMDIDVDVGQQACSISYSLAGSNNVYDVTVVPKNFYSNDPNNPPRFRTFTMISHAQGQSWPGAGSSVNVSNIVVRSIPSEATNQDRFGCSCTFGVEKTSRDAKAAFAIAKKEKRKNH